MFIENVLKWGAILFVVWQVVVPVVRNRPMFPLFRPKTAGQKQVRRAEVRKGEAEDMAEAAAIEADAKAIEKQVNKSRTED